MKKTLYTILLLLVVSIAGIAQNKVMVTAKVYDEMKAKGALSAGVRYQIIDDKPSYKVPYRSSETGKKAPMSNICECLIPLDSSFSVAEFVGYSPPDYRNDDGSTAAKTLPFNFCLYGTNYNQVYINNNGNISFGDAIGGFSAGGFPAGSSSSTANDTIMVAPFWADVQTSNVASGLVYYKITSTYMIVRWDHVGYFSNMADLVNDFQLIITDGNDPILPAGQNIGLCYGDMQWTTGGASGGTNGFGGTPATAGVNGGSGNIADCAQLGRFDQPGSFSDGSWGLNDGVDFLDNNNFVIPACAGNIPPIATPYVTICDTFKICDVNDTLVFSFNYTDLDSGQIVASITASAPSLGANFSIVNTTTGPLGNITFMIIANSSLVGNHTITITATDNGSPSASNVILYNVPIVLNGVPPPNPDILESPPLICANSGSSTFTLNNASVYDSYFWSNGVSNGPITVTDNNVYYLTVEKNGCFKSVPDSVLFKPSPTPLILGPLALCGGSTANLYVDSATLYPTISWSTGSSNDSVNVPGGTYSVTVTDASGCTATSPVVTVSTSALDVTYGALTFCEGDSTLLTATATPSTGVSSITWSNSANTPTIYVDTTGEYYATVNYTNGCVISDTITVYSIPIGTPNTSFSYTSPVCKLGANPTINPAPGMTPGGTFTASGGLNINSSTGQINLASSPTGTFNVTYTVPASACGPQGSSVASITINPPASPTLNFAYQTVCANDTNQLPFLVPGFDSGGVFSSTPGLSIVDSTGELVFTQSTPGTYTVTYTLQNDTSLAGCQTGGQDTAVILIRPLPSINITGNQLMWIGESLTIAANSDTSNTYYWNPALTVSCPTCDTTVATPPETQSYCVTVTDTMGCIDSACTKIVVQIPCITNSNLEVPNAFTPNGDGYNDELCLHGWTDCVTKFQIVIYDRWGEMVYQSSDADFCWDGIYKGNLLNSGVFVYFIKATFVVSGDRPSDAESKNEVNKKGNITIIH